MGEPGPSIGAHRLLAYDDWANAEVLASLRAAEDPPARAVRILAHIAAAQRLWLGRMGGDSRSVPAWPEWDLPECASQLGALTGLWSRFLGDPALSEPSRPISYENSRGERWASTVHDILLHLGFHGAYHRGQIATLLGAAGQRAAYTDFIHAVRQGFVG
jgi:uncharacterized damage-inducible protein DinB